MKHINGLTSAWCLRASALLMLLSLTHCAPFSALTNPQPDAGAETVPAELPEPSTPDVPAVQQQQGALQADTIRPILAPALSAQFEQAKRLMREKNYQAAHAILLPLSETVPGAAGIRYNLALCYLQLQQTELAQQQLIAVSQQQGDYVEALNLLGVLARRAGNFNQARRYWLDALAQQGDYANAHKNLAFLYELYLAQPQQARYHYQQYQQLTADPMAEAWLSLLEQQE
tara:strand:+ start:3299 stop:3988 length:690 start_codon:yes stop_codon:yes gene_type:complete